MSFAGQHDTEVQFHPVLTAQNHFVMNLVRYRREHKERHAVQGPALLAALRSSGFERALIGKEAVRDWFTQMGLGSRQGEVASWETIRRWRRLHGCPILQGRGPKSTVWTTTALLSVWVLSLFSTDERGGPRLLRQRWAKPFRQPAKRSTVRRLQVGPKGTIPSRRYP